MRINWPQERPSRRTALWPVAYSELTYSSNCSPTNCSSTNWFSTNCSSTNCSSTNSSSTRWPTLSSARLGEARALTSSASLTWQRCLILKQTERYGGGGTSIPAMTLDATYVPGSRYDVSVAPCSLHVCSFVRLLALTGHLQIYKATASSRGARRWGYAMAFTWHDASLYTILRDGTLGHLCFWSYVNYIIIRNAIHFS